MSFQAISDLFQGQADVVGESDIQFAIERFLRAYTRNDALYCSVQNMGKVIRVRVHGPALALQVILLERDLRFTIKQELGCDIGSIRVMLE
ncbi:MAG: hypothetical protein A3E36_04100 [Candidatus Andersenbacteria bacterium RIFCSPHIGHO2_12_FULL_45_11b]|uniref:DUF721 domain-containing protein n=1 Tax=Candidatus Andersenbacteria bacterium RIFCSPHIGHO2_12_FULL_45_11b TaxID=1797282 RepID=A0A1G1XBS5_9BACT|nr:MAG: hypothetical protein A3E36_04100 [Candidatus Andersenbacteria bacterium RIFCSPHIGHO2_12_FULL_45_11b]